MWRRSRSTEHGACSCDEGSVDCSKVTCNSSDASGESSSAPIFADEDATFDDAAESLRRTHAVLVAAYADHPDPRVRRHVCDPWHVVRVMQ